MHAACVSATLCHNLSARTLNFERTPFACMPTLTHILQVPDKERLRQAARAIDRRISKMRAAGEELDFNGQQVLASLVCV